MAVTSYHDYPLTSPAPGVGADIKHSAQNLGKQSDLLQQIANKTKQGLHCL